ncbi:MAG: hypothetical protein LBL77_01625 [Endomicrobium sp.]|jgi:hypothetical protein|nr:hypothetical protein [Endomicrobium sp.]
MVILILVRDENKCDVLEKHKDDEVTVDHYIFYKHISYVKVKDKSYNSCQSLWVTG